MAALLVVAGAEGAAEQRLLIEHGEGVGADLRAARLLRRRRVVAEVRASVREGSKAGESLGLAVPVLQIRQRHAAAAEVSLPRRRENVEAAGVLERQATNGDRIDQRKHSGVPADAPPKRDNC